VSRDAVTPERLLDAGTIARTVMRLGSEIEADHPDGVVLVVVLKGALLFGADLARAIRRVPVEIDFISISRFAPDSGRVKILHDLDTDIGGRDVVLVEDIVDTGLTVAYLTNQLEMREPRTLGTCALLDRPGRRIVPQTLQYRGVEIDDQFVLGYGLHVRDLYRNLPFVVAGERADVVAAPNCYVRDLYRGGGDASEGGGSVTDGTDARSEVL
jgi:hypoxanthine phosphoribosyltransferase